MEHNDRYGNIAAYLAWRGDVPFAADPFNEVDALILAELSYTEFENMPSDDETVSIEAVRDRFFEKHTREEIRESSAFIDKGALLMDDMVSGGRFKNTRLCNYVRVTDPERDLQFAAVTFLLEDGTAYAAFRGTDNSIAGWREDFDFSFLPETEGQRIAAKYLETVMGKYDRPFRVGGHSKGGNFAVYAASFCGEKAQQSITEVWSLDGPGFRPETTEKEGYLAILPKIKSIVPDTCIIGILLERKFTNSVIKSTASGILQHDGFSWVVDRNRFLCAETSEMGRAAEQIISEWVGGMDDETRKSFTATVFDSLESTGQESFDELIESKLRSAEGVLSSLVHLPKEKRMELLKLTASLIRSGGQAAMEFLPSLLLGKNGEDGEEEKEE